MKYICIYYTHIDTINVCTYVCTIPTAHMLVKGSNSGNRGGWRG